MTTADPIVIPVRLASREEKYVDNHVTGVAAPELEVAFERQPIGDEKFDSSRFRVHLRLKGESAEPFRTTALGSLYALQFEPVLVSEPAMVETTPGLLTPLSPADQLPDAPADAVTPPVTPVEHPPLWGHVMPLDTSER